MNVRKKERKNEWKCGIMNERKKEWMKEIKND